MSEQYEIVFRQLQECPSWSAPGIRWAVELWPQENAFPVATAWVVATDLLEFVDWIHVMEDERRKGFATALLRAIEERWPHVHYEAATVDGEDFLRTYATLERKQ